MQTIGNMLKQACEWLELDKPTYEKSMAKYLGGSEKEKAKELTAIDLEVRKELDMETMTVGESKDVYIKAVKRKMQKEVEMIKKL